MGQKRVETTIINKEDAAKLLGVEPDKLPALLRKHGVKGQTVRVAERRAVVYGMPDVEVGDGDSFQDVFVGTNSVAEILEDGVTRGSFKGTVMQARAYVRLNAKDPTAKGFQKAHFQHVAPDKVKAALTPEALAEFFPQ